MIRRIVLPVIFLVLVYGFWISPDFKEIAAGVAIFLFGMLFLEEGFRAFTGGLLEKLLSTTTDKLWKAISFGVVSTTIMQSSSLVSVITISFLSAELIALAAGIGIIFGANIGTTTGAWLIAGLGLKVKISAYAMPMLVFGIVLVFQNNKSLKGIGYILAGLGFLFLGIHYMKEGFEAFKETIDLSEFAIPGYAGLFAFTGIGIFATVVMQSSHATLVLIITALAAGQITYENALALAIGANIGTTITAILGSLSANYQGKRLAAGHLIFNMITGVIAIVFIHQLVVAVDSTAAAVGIRDDDYTLKLAVFHTIFNVIGVAVLVPFVRQLVNFLERVIPAPAVLDIAEPKYLNESVIEFPETLLEAVRNETIHLYDNAVEIIAHGINLHRTQIFETDDLEQLVASERSKISFDLDTVYERKVKVLYARILEFITRAQGEVPPGFADQLYALRQTCRQIVMTVKDVKHLRKNVSHYITDRDEDIRREYNELRHQIASLLREIHDLRNTEEDERNIIELDAYRIAVDEESTVMSGGLDDLIREGKITPVMATSLMNDHGYARDAVWQLTDIARTLFGSKDMADMEAEELIGLDDDDVDELSQIRDTA
ncbi:MAG: Na/Pi symporter [Alphaproteobacteria bacterium]|nr:Na/Pi symporter [Alphaproteobacteria bacterium]